MPIPNSPEPDDPDSGSHLDSDAQTSDAQTSDAQTDHEKYPDERQLRLEAIVNNAVDAIITIDQVGIIESVNPATERLFGYSPTELIAQNVKMLMPQNFQVQHDGYLRNYLTTGVRKIIGIGREVTGQRKDGSVFPMHLAVSEITFGNRRLFTGVVRDISDLKIAERKLDELNSHLEDRVRIGTEELHSAQAELVRNEKFSTLGKVAGGIAHEIRNPLNAVKTSAYYLLNAKQISPEKTREHLERIDRQVTIIDNVITALKDVAKLPEAVLVPAEIEPILRSTIQSIELDSNVIVEFAFPVDLPQVLIDENQIVIALENIIRNARDAMADGGTLKVSASAEGEEVELSFADTGCGISPDDLSRVLEPLFTTKARGMGLGLSITRTIVEKNKGRLGVESELGAGSRFWIVLRCK
ncbi:MAG: two-component system sensor kinase FixL [Mariniblastus sp.]|jgi:two-component system sensor kinase FixL